MKEAALWRKLHDMRLLVFSFFFLHGSLFAQDLGIHPQSGKRGLPLDGQLGIDNSWRDERTWALKISPLHIAVGDFAMYYEQRLGKMMSIEFGAGVTVSGLNRSIQPANSDDVLFCGTLSYVQYQSEPVSDGGFLGAVEFRIYPFMETKAMRSLYIAPAVKYKRYNYGLRDYTALIPNFKANDQHYNAYLNCGFQFWPNRKFVIDVFLGAGMGYHISNEAVKEYNYVADVIGVDEGYWRETTSNNLVFLLNTGVKFGIGGGTSIKKKQSALD